MDDHINHDLWIATMEADRLLNRLPSEQIAYLGDGFGWTVTSDDVAVASRYLAVVRVQALLIGLKIAQLPEMEVELNDELPDPDN